MNNRKPSVIYSEEVKLAKKTFVLAIVAFWALVTNHCGLEMIPGLKLLACSPQTQAAAHLPSGCGDNDGCATVESGQYRPEENQLSSGNVPLVALVYALTVLSDLVALEPQLAQISPEVTPPELAQTWHFSFRTALPPRAPSFVS